MPITSTWNGATYAGNGSTTSFNYGQPLQSIYDLNVFLTDNNGINYPALTSGVDYQINGIGGSSSGWNITYPLNGALAALPTGWSITVQLATPLVTNSNITTINTNSGTAIQLAIDRLTMQDLSQQLEITNNAALVAGGGVLSVNGNIGNVVVTTANTPATGNNSTLIATTAFVQADQAALFATPPALGSTTPAAVSATTLTANSTKTFSFRTNGGGQFYNSASTFAMSAALIIVNTLFVQTTAASTWTLPLGTAMDTAAGANLASGDQYPFFISNCYASGAITLSGNTGFTLGPSAISIAANTSRYCIAIRNAANTWILF